MSNEAEPVNSGTPLEAVACSASNVHKPMSRTTKHPPKPDRFTKKHRTGGHQARSKRVLATLRFLRMEHTLPDYIINGIKRRAGEETGPNLKVCRPLERAGENAE